MIVNNEINAEKHARERVACGLGVRLEKTGDLDARADSPCVLSAGSQAADGWIDPSIGRRQPNRLTEASWPRADSPSTQAPAEADAGAEEPASAIESWDRIHRRHRTVHL